MKKMFNRTYKIEITILVLFFTIYSNIYNDFSKFCNDNFGAEKENLVYEMFGNNIEIVEQHSWKYISRNSACFVYKTNLPSKSSIKYWEVNSLDTLHTDTTDGYYYTHTHYLNNLIEDKTYYYELKVFDERNNTKTLDVMTFNSTSPENLILLPDQIDGPPFFLNESGATYLLTKDINANATAINIMASNITVDLGGYNLTYNAQAEAFDSGAVEGDFGHYGIVGTHGIRSKYGLSNCKIFNGTITQGQGNGGEGYQPIYQASGINEIAGVTMIYQGTQLSGINSASFIHHSTIIDTGTEITNRHQGIDAIHGADSICHNLIKRARHRGISVNNDATIHNNEIYIDSWATNSYGIFTYGKSDVKINDNKIFGTGYHAIGIGTVSAGVRNIDIFNNLIHMQATSPVDRSSEYGPQSSANGIRITWGGENLNFKENYIISKAIDSGYARGVWFCPNEEQSDIIFQDNIIKAIADNEHSNKFGAVVVSGEDSPNVSSGIFHNNTIISNFCNVLLGEPYGYGNNTHFNNNTFIKSGNNDNYRTIQCGFWDKNNSGNIFTDSKFESGASYESVLWNGTSGERDYSVKWSLIVSAPEGTLIEIKNSHNISDSTKTISNQQYLREELLQYTNTADSMITYTPHTVKAIYNGDTQTVDIFMDSIKTISFFGIQIAKHKNNTCSKNLTFYSMHNKRAIKFNNLQDDINIKLYHLNGKQLLHEKIHKNNTQKYFIIPQYIPSGLYIISLNFLQKNISSKIIIP